MGCSGHSRVCLEVDLQVLQENYRCLCAKASPCDVQAVVKANAYGMGVLPVARALIEAGVPAFGVSGLNEALELVPLGKPVQVVGALLPSEVEGAVAAGVILTITDRESAARISDAAVRQSSTATCHVLVDTGMGRLGTLADAAIDDIEYAATLPGVSLQGVCSHFPMAVPEGVEYTLGQVQRFGEILNALETRGLSFSVRHVANSDALLNFPQAVAPPFNRARIGLVLHGPLSGAGAAIGLRPTLELKSALVSVRDLPVGTRVGYNCTYTTARDMRVGVVSAGYADGVPLALSNAGEVLVRGRRCQVLGRVSMDYMTVDLRDVPDALVGEEVVCLGRSCENEISVADWASLKGTHAYDIICSLSQRVPRVYVGQPAPASRDGTGPG